MRNGSTTFVNTTGVTAASFTGDADPAPLVGYIGKLRHAVSAGSAPPEGTAALTGEARATRVRIAVPLLVRGTVGGRTSTRG